MGALGRGGCRGDADSERCLSGRWDGDGDGNDAGRAILRVIDRAVPLAAENFYYKISCHNWHPSAAACVRGAASAWLPDSTRVVTELLPVAGISPHLAP
jgi:hypothetical protein